MKQISLLLLLFWFTTLVAGQEISFKDIQFPAADGSLTKAKLTFDDVGKQVMVRVSDGRVFNVAYRQIDKIGYEYSKKHRIKNGAEVAVLSPGTGAILAFTKSRNHWLEIDFHDQNSSKVLILKLSKHDYQQVCEAAKSHSGQEVKQIGETTAQAIKDKLKK